MFLVLKPKAFESGTGDAQEGNMAGDEIDEDPKLPPDERLDSLEERLKRAQAAEANKASKRQGDPAWRTGQLVLSHLVGAPLGAGILGWLLDRWLGTRPWLMLVLLFVGFAVGVFDVLRISKTPPGDQPGIGL